MLLYLERKINQKDVSQTLFGSHSFWRKEGGGCILSKRGGEVGWETQLQIKGVSQLIKSRHTACCATQFLPSEYAVRGKMEHNIITEKNISWSIIILHLEVSVHVKLHLWAGMTIDAERFIQLG